MRRGCVTYLEVDVAERRLAARDDRLRFGVAVEDWQLADSLWGGVTLGNLVPLILLRPELILELERGFAGALGASDRREILGDAPSSVWLRSLLNDIQKMRKSIFLWSLSQ